MVQLINSSGIVLKTYDYDAFGNEKNPDINDPNLFRYCGEYFDKEIGTYYLRARYYNPVIGRFITEDSYFGKENAPLSLNLYTYSLNNPILHTDPTGNTGEIAATYAATGWTVNFIPGYGQVVYIVGWVGVGIVELVNSPAFPAVCQWMSSDAIPWIEQTWTQIKDFYELCGNINQVSKDIGDSATKLSNWVKEQVGGGSGSQDPNKYNKGKPTNLPSWRKVKIDMKEIITGHTQEGQRAIQSFNDGKGKDLFHNMDSAQIEKAIRQAYKMAEKVYTQGDRIFVRGQYGNMTIEMWVNTITKTIETAWPKF